MKGKEGKRRRISLTIIAAILIYISFVTPTMLADYIIANFTPTNDPPIIILDSEIPSNGSTGIGIRPTCSIDIMDPNGDLMDINWYENSTGSWVWRKTTSSVLDGTYQWTFSQASSYSTTYYWKVVVNDSYHNTTAIFHFTTESEPPPPPPPPPNEDPVANITGPTSGYVNQTLIFYANESYDPDGTIVGYRWDFDNDGLFDTGWIEDTFITLNYSNPGNYSIKLQVMDDDNATDTDIHNVTILPLEPPLELPVAEANGPYYGFTNESINFSSNGSYDPDGNITNYTWYFGDNHISYLENPTHSYSEPREYHVILTVRDNDNLTNNDTATVNVTNRSEEPPPPLEETEFPLLTLMVVFMGIIVSLIVIALIYKKYQDAKLIEMYEKMKKEEQKKKKVSMKSKKQGVKSKAVKKPSASKKAAKSKTVKKTKK